MKKKPRRKANKETIQFDSPSDHVTKLYHPDEPAQKLQSKHTSQGYMPNELKMHCLTKPRKQTCLNSCVYGRQTSATLTTQQKGRTTPKKKETRIPKKENEDGHKYIQSSQTQGPTCKIQGWPHRPIRAEAWRYTQSAISPQEATCTHERNFSFG